MADMLPKYVERIGWLLVLLAIIIGGIIFKME